VIGETHFGAATHHQHMRDKFAVALIQLRMSRFYGSGRQAFAGGGDDHGIGQRLPGLGFNFAA